jgi:hypothetical protein
VITLLTSHPGGLGVQNPNLLGANALGANPALFGANQFGVNQFGLNQFGANPGDNHIKLFFSDTDPTT